MADIFISYAREDAVVAADLAKEFEALGWSAWHDDAIRAGTPFDAVIDRELDAASCVVVIWSRASVESKWVRGEASAADDQGKLVPITFELGLRPPIQFRQLNTSHLTSTDIREGTTDSLRLLADIARLTGKPPVGVDATGVVGTPVVPRVTVGRWRISVRFLGVGGYYDLMLHPNGTASGKAKWAISRADLAGRWAFDPVDQVLQLELSGGLMEGTKAMPVKITRWDGPDSAAVVFDGRKARLERLPP